MSCHSAILSTPALGLSRVPEAGNDSEAVFKVAKVSYLSSLFVSVCPGAPLAISCSHLRGSGQGRHLPVAAGGEGVSAEGLFLPALSRAHPIWSGGSRMKPFQALGRGVAATAFAPFLRGQAFSTDPLGFHRGRTGERGHESSDLLPHLRPSPELQAKPRRQPCLLGGLLPSPGEWTKAATSVRSGHQIP